MAARSDDALLSIEGVDLWFGGTHALNDVTFDVKPGEIFGIIGPNGAGKSSLLNCINGYYKPRSGRIVFDGRELTGVRPHTVAKRGIGRTFQNIELSADSTVLDNVMLGRHLLIRSNPVSEILQLPGARREERQSRERVAEILELVGLGDVQDQPVSDLPYGQQKLVELARALATDPKLLLLDEPTAGMTGEERTEVAAQLRKLAAKTDVTLVLIEHDTGFIRGLTDRVAVLDFGALIALGTPEQVMSEQAVIEAYLGASESVVETLLADIRD
ncbi:MAG: branched-chain amino acid transport system ATP-binding protein [Subtercola sp.]|nr:branched-chain amino acid transport system ATP-binding protein [Subtercola sp.]